jgi:hypothetical protein
LNQPRTMPESSQRQRPASGLAWRWAALCAPALATVLAACGGGSAGPTVEGHQAALSASKPGELAQFVQGKLRTLQAQGRLLAPQPTLIGDGTQAVSLSPGVAAAPPMSGTLVQEEGVDEADLLKTDGRHLYTLQPQVDAGVRVAAYARASDGRADALGSLVLPTDGARSISADGMVLSVDQKSLAVISQHWAHRPDDTTCPEVCTGIAIPSMRSSVHVQRVDVTDPAAVAAGERISIDGALVDSRRIGDWLYLVTTHRPVLAAEQLPATATPAQREAAIAKLTAADVLPRMRRNGGAPVPLLADTDCLLQTGNASTNIQFTTVTVFDLKSPTLAHSNRCFAGGSEALYLSPGNLYIATTRWDDPTGAASVGFPSDTRTDIHKFALAGGSVAYRGSGSVDGHLGWDPQRKSFRLSEHNGDLRVLTYTGSFGWFTIQDAQTAPPSPARLTVLRERSSDQTLQVVATLPNAARPAHIGKPGEQVYGVRFLGDRAYVVTFRRTDPLYVLDLSDPADPRTVGEVEVAGFSESLFVLPNNLLLGVGRDADQSGRITGLKVALFDVHNPAAPAERSALTLGMEGSASTLDSARHGLSLRVKDNVVRLALPMVLATTPHADWQHGLQKLEVDTSARTLRALGWAGAVGNGLQASLWLERSVQIGDTVYYLSQGTLTSQAW